MCSVSSRVCCAGVASHGPTIGECRGRSAVGRPRGESSCFYHPSPWPGLQVIFSLRQCARRAHAWPCSAGGSRQSIVCVCCRARARPTEDVRRRPRESARGCRCSVSGHTARGRPGVCDTSKSPASARSPRAPRRSDFLNGSMRLPNRSISRFSPIRCNPLQKHHLHPLEHRCRDPRYTL